MAVEEKLSWLDAAEEVMATETRRYLVHGTGNPPAYHWDIRTCIEPVGGPLRLGASRKSHYSGFELRIGTRRLPEPTTGAARERRGTRASWVSGLAG